MSSQVTLYKTIITESIEEAASLLRQGQTVIFPTETVYGLGADATNPVAAASIFEAKRRPADNPLIVHIYDLAQVEKLTNNVPDFAWKLMEAYFPGPLTVLLPKSSLIPDTTTAGSTRVCLRMPSLPLARDFLRACDVPVAAPSANLSGKPSPTRWEDCLEDMMGRVGAILKGPEATFGLESTIVDCSGPVPVLMRPGIITLEEMARLVPEIKGGYHNPSLVLPGMKYRHYAPNAKVVLVEKNEVPANIARPCAYIGLKAPGFEPDFQYKAASMEDYAHQLFAFMREADRRNIKEIYAERVEENGLGRALMNRLNKASA